MGGAIDDCLFWELLGLFVLGGFEVVCFVGGYDGCLLWGAMRVGCFGGNGSCLSWGFEVCLFGRF